MKVILTALVLVASFNTARADETGAVVVPVMPVITNIIPPAVNTAPPVVIPQVTAPIVAIETPIITQPPVIPVVTPPLVSDNFPEMPNTITPPQVEIPVVEVNPNLPSPPPLVSDNFPNIEEIADLPNVVTGDIFAGLRPPGYNGESTTSTPQVVYSSIPVVPVAPQPNLSNTVSGGQLDIPAVITILTTLDPGPVIPVSVAYPYIVRPVGYFGENAPVTQPEVTSPAIVNSAANTGPIIPHDPIYSEGGVVMNDLFAGLRPGDNVGNLPNTGSNTGTGTNTNNGTGNNSGNNNGTGTGIPGIGSGTDNTGNSGSGSGSVNPIFAEFNQYVTNLNVLGLIQQAQSKPREVGLNDLRPSANNHAHPELMNLSDIEDIATLECMDPHSQQCPANQAN